VFPSIRASTVDLFIIISNNIKAIYTKIMLIRSKHLCYCNIVRSTGYLLTSSSFDSIMLNLVLFKGTRSRTRPNRSYIKSCMYRSPNSSLLKGGGVRGRGPEEVSRVGHLGYRYRLLLF
jgi:hypothetical protein